MDFSLTGADVSRFNRVLEELLEHSESTGCLVCDHGGYIIAQQGVDFQDPLLISALGAGVFAASRELARLLGEDDFSAVFHQGEKRSIFICAVTLDVLLVVIFSNEATVGLVKLYATPAVAAMRKIIQELREHAVSKPHTHAFVLNDDGQALFTPKTP